MLCLYIFFTNVHANNGEISRQAEINFKNSFLLQANHSDRFYYAVFLLNPDFTPAQTTAHTLFIDRDSFGYYEPVYFNSTDLTEDGLYRPSGLLLFIPQPSDQRVNLAAACWKYSSLPEDFSPLPPGFSPSVSRKHRYVSDYAVQYQGEELELIYRGEHGLQYIMTRDGVRQALGAVCTTSDFEVATLKTPLLSRLPVAATIPDALSHDAIQQQLRQMQIIVDIVLGCKSSEIHTVTSFVTPDIKSESVRVSKRRVAMSFDPVTAETTGCCSSASDEAFVRFPEESFADLLRNSRFIQKDCKILCEGAIELFSQLSRVERDELYLKLLSKGMVPANVKTTNDLPSMFFYLQQSKRQPWDYQGLFGWLGLAAQKHGERLSAQTVNTLRIYEPLFQCWVESSCLFYGTKRTQNLNKCLEFIFSHVGYAALTDELLGFYAEHYPDLMPARFNPSCDEAVKKMWKDIHIALVSLICTDLYAENNELLTIFLGHYLEAVSTVNLFYVKTVLTLLPASFQSNTIKALKQAVLSARCMSCMNSPADNCSNPRLRHPISDHRQEESYSHQQHEHESDGIEFREQLRIKQQEYTHLKHEYSVLQRSQMLYRSRTSQRLQVLQDNEREVQLLRLKITESKSEVERVRDECQKLSSALEAGLRSSKIDAMCSTPPETHVALLDTMKCGHKASFIGLMSEKATVEQRLKKVEGTVSEYQAKLKTTQDSLLDYQTRLKSTQETLSGCQAKLDVYQRKWPEDYARILQARSQFDMSFFQLQRDLQSFRKKIGKKDPAQLEVCISQMESEWTRQCESVQKVLNSKNVNIVYLKCVICLDFAEEAFYTSECGHIYCGACTDKLMKSSGTKNFSSCSYCKKHTFFRKIHH